ncbi:MAG TPA: WYL domain-containing protein, partial [Acidimicrobiales bacterium]|nr:WYL domain-containing protein [Acidimicrobiales bacterium]
GPGGPLATALEKLDRALGLDSGDALDIELAEVDAAVLATLRAGVEGHTKVRIDYYSYGRDQRSTRVVRPWRLFNQAGQWYLHAWCENVSAERHFRVDRIESVTALAEVFAPPARPRPAPDSAAVYHPQSDDPVWVLDLDPPAHWIAEQYPNEAVEERGGSILRVTLRAARSAWLERLLLRAGSDVRVVQGDRAFGAAAASRVLARYRASSEDPVL